MYQTVQSFVEDYRSESAGTQKLLDALTDESLNQEVAPGFRTLGQLAWHLCTSGGFLQPTGLKFEYPSDESERPSSASEIAQAYRKMSESLLEAVQTQWTDESLQLTSPFFGEQWKNGMALDGLIKHEIHHRGQLTVLMRQAGIPVTGVYGPAKEEWAAMGMAAPV
ncbi:DinB family protein [Paenibacillus hamazuiensis]|uniref:DinB family protein n=1 Tax=Paenibacillus hamazuiensis TaxID=2936508 RepID=UPI00201087AB